MFYDYWYWSHEDPIAKEAYIFRWREGQLLSYRGSIYKWGTSKAKCKVQLVGESTENSSW